MSLSYKDWNFERIVCTSVRSMKAMREHLKSMFLAVYWTRNVTQEHAIPLSTRTTHKKLRKLNSIASPIPVVLLFLPYGLPLGSSWNPSTTFVLAKSIISFSSKPRNFIRLWLPAFSRGHVCLREQGDAKIHLA